MAVDAVTGYDSLVDSNDRMRQAAEVIKQFRSSELAPDVLAEVKKIHAMQIPPVDRAEQIAALLSKTRAMQDQAKPTEVQKWPAKPEDRYQSAMSAQLGTVPFDVPPELIEAIIHHESSGDPGAVGKIGEMGLMQISPAVAQDYGVTMDQLKDPEINRSIGTHYLGTLLKKYKGNAEDALMAYNGGPANVDNNTVSPAARSYATNVLETFGNLAGKAMGTGTAEAGDGPSMEPGAKPSWWDNAGVEVKAPAAQAAQAPQTPPPPSPEEWQKMLAGAGLGAAPPPQKGAPAGEGLFEHMGRAYRENIAAPATDYVEKGVEALRQKLPENPLKIPGIGLEGPAVSRNVAENLVPQTTTDAAIDASGFLLPAVRIGGEVAEGAGLLRRALTTKPGNTAATTAIGAITGKLTGEGAEEGAWKGGLSSALGHGIRGSIGIAGRHFAGKTLADRYSQDIAELVSTHSPQTKARTATDLATEFAAGESESPAVLRAGQSLAQTKAKIDASLPPGTKFTIPMFDGFDARGLPKIKIHRVNFSTADNMLSSMGDKGYNPVSGQPRTPAEAKAIRQIAFNAKNDLIKQLNVVKPGSGQVYGKARGEFASTKAWSDLLSEPGVFDAESGQVVQGKLAELYRRDYYDQFVHAVGPRNANKIIKSIGRGYAGAARDVAGEPFAIHSSSIGGSSHGLFPRLHPRLGSTSKPVGQLPWYARPGQGIPQLLATGILNEYMGDSNK